MSISTKISLLLLLMLVVGIANIFVIYNYQDSQEHDAHVVNVAGRQRMLSQKISKLALSIAYGNDNDRNALKEAVNLYSSSLESLWHGGDVMEGEIPPAPITMEKLFKKNDAIWKSYKEETETVIKEERENPLFSNAVDYIYLNSEGLLSISDELTGKLDKIFSYRAFKLRVILMSMLGFDIIIFLFGYVLGVKLVRPIKELSIAATKVGRGDLANKMKVTSRDEIGELGKAFNKMIDNLESTRKEIVSAKDYTENILANMIDSLIVVDLDGLIRTVNQATLDLLGYREEEILGKPVSIIFRFKEKEIPKKTKIQELSEEGHIRDYKTKSGESIPVSLFAPIMQSKDGRLLGYVCVARDMRQTNKLIIDLEKARSEIEEWSKTLERRVGVRTEELAVAKEGLERKVKEIVESEEKYRKLIESAQDAIFVVDIETGIILDASTRAEDLLGMPVKEIVGMHHTQLYPTEEVEHTEELFKKYTQIGKGTTAENIFVQHRDGRKIPVEISCSFFEIGGKNIIQGIFRDITERNKADEQIRKLSHAIEQSSSTIVITDTKGKIEFVNPRFAELTGYTIEETIGKNPRILKSGKTPSGIYKELWKTIMSGNEWRGEFCNKKKSGELYWESASISPVKDDKGVITHFIAVKDDITEQKKMEEELQKSEARYRTVVDDILDNSIVGIFILDEDIKIVWVNKVLEQYFGLNREEIIGKDKRQTIRSKIKGIFEDSENFMEKVFATYDNNTYLESFECHVLPEGEREERWLLHQSMPIKSGLYKGGRVEFYHDITERKKMEEALMQSEKLKSLGTITAGISHDFNNILAIISGKIQLLEMEYEDNKHLTDELSLIMKAADDGAEISRRMLKFTKTTKDTSGFLSFDINELINQAIDFTKPRWRNEAQAKGINYKIDTECMKGVSSILCNPTELREIFINIINNALYSMPEGGSISFSIWRGDDTVFVSISDTGDGMSEEVKKRIFEPFFTTKGVVGTGLGMSMAYGIVSRHGGKIEVESEVGKGTTFTLQFPTTNRRASLIATTEQEQETKNKGLCILVVDDEEAICDILDKFLSGGGHKVEIVDNGADAIELMKKGGFDLVLSDLAMPDVFGYDVIMALNGLEKRPKIGIITGWGEKLGPMEEGMEVDFIIKKPFDFSELTKQINDLNI